MALNVAKCTIGFQQDTYGWTESYYLNNATVSLTDEAAKLAALIPKRIALSGQQTFVSFAKLSNETLQRDVLLSYYGDINTSPYKGTSGQDSDFRDTSLLVQRKNLNRTSRAPMYLRGIWDTLVQLGGNFRPSVMWTGLWNQYVAELTGANGWGFLGKDPAGPVKVSIANVVQAANNSVTITTNNNTFTVGQIGTKIKIFVSGVQGAGIVNGNQIVVPSTAKICETVKRIPIFPYISGGFLTNSVPVFNLISAVDYTRAVERKAGRPLYQSRGRAKARTYS